MRKSATETSSAKSSANRNRYCPEWPFSIKSCQLKTRDFVRILLLLREFSRAIDAAQPSGIH